MYLLHVTSAILPLIELHCCWFLFSNALVSVAVVVAKIPDIIFSDIYTTDHTLQNSKYNKIVLAFLVPMSYNKQKTTNCPRIFSRRE